MNQADTSGQTPRTRGRHRGTARLLGMRRWLCMILLALLPLQSVWAAAAAHCEHESGPHPSHFGHHEGHHHDAPVDPLEGVADSSSDGEATHCHGICAVMIATAPGMPSAHAESPVTACTNVDIQGPALSPPERPQWMGRA